MQHSEVIADEQRLDVVFITMPFYNATKKTTVFYSTSEIDTDTGNLAFGILLGNLCFDRKNKFGKRRAGGNFAT
jgi:hypothetical protein